MNDLPPRGYRLADAVRRIGLHEHLCLIYQTQEQQLSAALPFLKIGLESGEKCLYIADANTAATLVNATRAQGIDADTAIRQGSLTITNREIYPSHDNFDPDRMIELLVQSVRKARSAGFSALRVMGEMIWVAGIDPRPERLMEFEAKLNYFCLDNDVLGICQYDRKLFRPEVILDVLRTHPTVVYDDSILKNPYYVPPEEFLLPHQSEKEVQRLLNNIRGYAAKEQALRTSEQQSRALIDTIPQQIWSGPPDGSNDFANERLRSYVGLGSEELHGQGWEVILHPDDRKRVKKAWHESVTNGTPYEQEERHRGVDGNYRWFLNRAVPMRDAEGRILRWYGTNTDIEDRKRAEEALRRSEAYLAEAQKLSHTGSWAFDPVRRVPIYWSAEWYRISGLDPAEGPSAEKSRALHTPEEWSRLMEVVDRAMRDKEDYQTDSYLAFPDGSTKYIHIVGHPVVDTSGDVVELVGTVMDVTERKRAEEKLRQFSGSLLRLQDEERRKIARDLHDSAGQDLVALQTILAQLKILIPSSNRKLRKLASECQALANQCIREVRTLSYVLHPPMLDETGLEDAIRHFAEGFTKRSGIPVDLQVSPGFGRIGRDAELTLFRVVQESLTNIQRHSGSSTATIRLSRDLSKVMLEVGDNGRGISGAEQGHAVPFPFGVGVGISSMRERLNQIGGRLEVDSSSGGTTIRATLALNA